MTAHFALMILTGSTSGKRHTQLVSISCRSSLRNFDLYFCNLTSTSAISGFVRIRGHRATFLNDAENR